MSSLSVKQKAALLQSGFSKGFNALNNNAKRRNQMAANLGGLPMTSANNNSWSTNNNNNKGNNFNNALSANGEIPANLFVSPPGSPTGLNNNSASNVGSVASSVAAQAAADPYAITPNKMAKAKAKWNKINANKRAAAEAAAAAPVSASVSAAAAAAGPSSSFSPLNMYASPSVAASVNQGPVYGPQLQFVMAKAFSKGASEAAKMGADYAGQQAAGREAAEYAKVMKMTETNAAGKVHYPGVEAEAANKASAAAKVRAAAAANPVAPARHWGTVQTGHRGAHRKSRKNRRSGRKSRKNRK